MDVMKRFSFPAVAVFLFFMNAAHAQTTESGFFNHLGAAVSLGTGGLGFDLAAPVTDWAAVRAGMSLSPGARYSAEVDLDVDTKSIITDQVKVEGKLNIRDFKLLLDLYPFRSGFHLTAGAFYGPEKFISLYNEEPFLAREDWGTAGVKIGEYRLTSDEYGNVEANIEVNGFKPYLGFGFGRAVPKKGRVGVSCDFGVKFWGTPGIYTWVEDNFGNREYKELTREGVNDEDFDDAFDIMSRITFYPVLNIRICGRIF